MSSQGNLLLRSINSAATRWRLMPGCDKQFLISLIASSSLAHVAATSLRRPEQPRLSTTCFLHNSEDEDELRKQICVDGIALGIHLTYSIRLLGRRVEARKSSDHQFGDIPDPRWRSGRTATRKRRKSVTDKTKPGNSTDLKHN